jgi:hypothetical protein
VVLLGWVVSVAGTALWIYGFFVTGNAPLIEWSTIAPWWIAEAFPNIQAELGMTLSCLGLVGVYWPSTERPPSKKH